MTPQPIVCSLSPRGTGPETDTGRCPPGGGVPGIPRCGGGGRSRRRNAALDESSAVRAMARAFSRAWRGSRGERKSSRTIRDAQHLFVQTGHVFLPRRVEFALCQARRFQVSLELAERAQPRADRGRRRTSEEHSITRSTRQLLSALGWGSRTVSTFPASARELFIRGGVVLPILSKLVRVPGIGPRNPADELSRNSSR